MYIFILLFVYMPVMQFFLSYNNKNILIKFCKYKGAYNSILLGVQKNTLDATCVIFLYEILV